jgi:nitroimidazol reductase NimA-like FMN-containing flavoprotein (pyridoxamine 5'-phosphate oxidase superfamily)
MKYEIKDLSRKEVDDFLKSQKVGLLTLAGDRKPYAVPLAYSYDNGIIYLTMRPIGRKMEHISKNRSACFVVFWMPADFGLTNMKWTSVICEGELEQITDRDGVTTAVRAGERHMGLPEGSWDRLIEGTMQNPSQSGFWKIMVQAVGGKSM